MRLVNVTTLHRPKISIPYEFYAMSDGFSPNTLEDYILKRLMLEFQVRGQDIDLGDLLNCGDDFYIMSLVQYPIDLTLGAFEVGVDYQQLSQRDMVFLIRRLWEKGGEAIVHAQASVPYPEGNRQFISDLSRLLSKAAEKEAREFVKR